MAFYCFPTILIAEADLDNIASSLVPKVARIITWEQLMIENDAVQLGREQEPLVLSCLCLKRTIRSPSRKSKQIKSEANKLKGIDIEAVCEWGRSCFLKCFLFINAS